jgi:hypothetical protein
MSGKKDEDRRRRARRRHLDNLVRAFDGGSVLAASSDAPGQPGVRRTLTVMRTAAGQANVTVEYYQAGDWDSTLETEEREFPDLEAALTWLESDRGISRLDLHEV